MFWVISGTDIIRITFRHAFTGRKLPTNQILATEVVTFDESDSI